MMAMLLSSMRGAVAAGALAAALALALLFLFDDVYLRGDARDVDQQSPDSVSVSVSRHASRVCNGVDEEKTGERALLSASVSRNRDRVLRTFSIHSKYKPTKGKKWLKRTDYDGVVRSTLLDLGLEQVWGTKADVVWGLQWTSLAEFEDANLTSVQLINMMPGMAKLALGDKDALHRTCRAAKRRFSTERFDFLLDSYEFPDDAAAWLHDNTDTRHQNGDSASKRRAWIWKELNSWSGDGVKAMSTPQVRERIESSKYPGRTAASVLQRYVLRPLTLLGHKFDVRWWALVTSIDPLRAYMLPDAYLKVASSKKYSPALSSLSDRCMHITNNKAQKECGGGDESSLDDLPTHLSDPRFESTLRNADGKKIPASLRRAEHYIESAKTIVAKTVLMALDDLRKHRVATRARCFQFLAFDIIYDSSGRGWLVEVNTNGFLGGGMVSAPNGYDNLRDMFDMAGVRGYDRSSYQDDLELKMASFCASRGSCTPEEQFIIQEYEDEMHATRATEWTAIYPRRGEAKGVLATVTKSLRDAFLFAWISWESE